MTHEAAQTQQQNTTSHPLTSGGILQRTCQSCGQHTTAGAECQTCQDEKKHLQRQSTQTSSVGIVPGIVHEVLSAPGCPLEPGARTFMEQRFGQNFSQVRVHTDTKASASAQSVRSQAYTVGSNIVFRSGSYAPNTNTGKQLIAHELTHVVQQAQSAGGLQSQLTVGANNDPAEGEADRVAQQVMGMSTTDMPPVIRTAPSGATLRRTPETPQRRGGRERLATLEQPQRGEDQVRIRVFRYLCSCMGRNVTRSSFSAGLRPSPGITYRFCRGQTTVRIRGEVVPDSFTSGTARLRGDVNIAPNPGGTGVRIQVEGEGRNTGDEPQVGGSGRVTIEPPGGPNIGLSGGAMVGTESGQVDSRAGVEVDLGNGTTIFGELTNPQDRDRIGGTVGIRGRFGGPRVQDERCRECACPVVYECLEDIPPRSYEEEIPYTVTEQTRIRYYFRLNSDQDSRDPGLRRESERSLSQLESLLAAGGTIIGIFGYASPEADEASLNQGLSESRARRLHTIVASRLGPDASLPEPEGRSELLGRRPTILPGSTLANVIFDSGFSGPEEVTDLLIGDQIPNDQLADQFLALFSRITEPAERLQLFGVGENSPIAPQLLAAIEQFIARRGRGRRPWDPIFAFLRFAVVEVSQTRQETRTEHRRTSGSMREVGEALCQQHAQRAEDEGLFGPAEREPSASACPTGHPPNQARFEDKCDYSG